MTSGLTRDWSLRQDLWRENGSRNYLFFFSLQNLSSSLSTLRPCEGHGAASNLKGEGIIKLWKDTVLVVFTEEREQLRELCGNGGSNEEEEKKWRQTWGSDMKFCEVEFFFLFFHSPDSLICFSAYAIHFMGLDPLYNLAINDSGLL